MVMLKIRNMKFKNVLGLHYKFKLHLNGKVIIYDRIIINS